jgi:exodeoxyribonuclease VII large subunit
MPGLLDKNRILSVGQLSDILKEVLQSELFMNIRVRGEIVSKQVKGGNVYLTLIDPEDSNLPPNKKATLRAIVFSYYQRSIVSTYNEGDQVIVRGDLSYYPPFGTISFIAKDLIEEGEGNELLKLKRLEEKLEKEGLFASERKRPLPKTVRKIGIITSASGAAYHDIMQTLSKKVPVNTVLFDAVVQGENAPASLIRALDKAYKSDIDVLIFGRGGGSKTDLSCFNDEKVVRKLAESPVPVVTGIGHEIDRSLCDLAADVYAITPTAAAEAVLPDEQAVRDDLSLKKRSSTTGRSATPRRRRSNWFSTRRRSSRIPLRTGS